MKPFFFFFKRLSPFPLLYQPHPTFRLRTPLYREEENQQNKAVQCWLPILEAGDWTVSRGCCWHGCYRSAERSCLDPTIVAVRLVYCRNDAIAVPVMVFVLIPWDSHRYRRILPVNLLLTHSNDDNDRVQCLRFHVIRRTLRLLLLLSWTKVTTTRTTTTTTMKQDGQGTLIDPRIFLNHRRRRHGRRVLPVSSTRSWTRFVRRNPFLPTDSLNSSAIKVVQITIDMIGTRKIHCEWRLISSVTSWEAAQRTTALTTTMFQETTPVTNLE